MDSGLLKSESNEFVWQILILDEISIHEIEEIMQY